jgi:hypothetical protein
VACARGWRECVGRRPISLRIEAVGFEQSSRLGRLAIVVVRSAGLASGTCVPGA